jgi:hypothetical protein
LERITRRYGDTTVYELEKYIAGVRGGEGRLHVMSLSCMKRNKYVFP